MTFGEDFEPSLCTIVRNVGGVARNFSCLPPHGRRLEVDQEISIPGNLMTLLADKPQQLRGLEYVLRLGRLAIVRTPGVVLEDLTSLESGELGVDGGVFGVYAPSYVGSA